VRRKEVRVLVNATRPGGDKNLGQKKGENHQRGGGHTDGEISKIRGKAGPFLARRTYQRAPQVRGKRYLRVTRVRTNVASTGEKKKKKFPIAIVRG